MVPGSPPRIAAGVTPGQRIRCLLQTFGGTLVIHPTPNPPFSSASGAAVGIVARMTEIEVQIDQSSMDGATEDE
jgi:hypothetical protein